MILTVTFYFNFEQINLYQESTFPKLQRTEDLFHTQKSEKEQRCWTRAKTSNVVEHVQNGAALLNTCENYQRCWTRAKNSSAAKHVRKGATLLNTCFSILSAIHCSHKIIFTLHTHAQHTQAHTQMRTHMRMLTMNTNAHSTIVLILLSRIFTRK